MGTGTIRTETDVRADSWYLDSTGRMPPGMLVGAGQAYLPLMGWSGVDPLDEGERICQLLSSQLTFHGSPPVPGETLRYEIHIDDHAQQDGARLFSFQCDGRVGDQLRLTARGQAGFFTGDELSGGVGVIWEPEAEQPPAPARLDPPAVSAAPSCYDAAAVRAFADGRPFDCFGTAWKATRTHIRSPRIGPGQMLLLGQVPEFDPSGGPWGRGYLRAETPITPGDWFFADRLNHDPFVPDALIFEGGLQAMAFYLAACGFTRANDGWRFEPVPGESYDVRHRAQVTPRSRSLTYEVFVSELSAGPEPTLFADVLCTVDGVQAFHARRVGVRLVPDWPLTQWGELGPPVQQETGDLMPPPALGGLQGQTDGGAAEADGFRFGYRSLMAFAWGRPTEAFGGMYTRFDGPRKVGRMPGPPYHFISRISAVTGPIGGMQAGSVVEAEYDVPDRAWYWEQNGQPTMPLAVLLEVALQPCGWLAHYVGCAVSVDTDLLFRNLDGSYTMTGHVTPQTRVLRTRVALLNISQNGTMILLTFNAECFAGDEPVFTINTTFGFFPPEVFVDQQGLPASEEDRARFAVPGRPLIDLTARPKRYCSGSLRLAGPMLLMLDRITSIEADGGRAWEGGSSRRRISTPTSGSSRRISSRTRSSPDPSASKPCSSSCSSTC